MPETATYHRLIEDNHKLIFAFCKSYGLDKNEFYDIAAIGLCRAALAYDPKRGIKFSTFAFRCMFNEFTKERLKAQRRNPDGAITVPLTPFEDRDEDETTNVWDGTDFTDNVHSNIDIERFNRSLNERERAVLCGRLLGKSCRSIGEELGFSRETTRTTLKHVGIKYDAIIRARRGFDECNRNEPK